MGREASALLANVPDARFDGREALQEIVESVAGLHAVAIYPRNALVTSERERSP
ncbi:hypothetical protein ENSA5_08820 [Enhygromyxa salina]|uniref:Uncharacterized protein n=1 Tax=Enhygromyxa salina TaxID=215803 RepID=A0A2S9YH27_9BACT|nr:hypothetical protein [Enhygromyxa salina]PRQ04316.1 hypothetical protein ENSA5_08820 [Enhygromyxa salina]